MTEREMIEMIIDKLGIDNSVSYKKDRVDIVLPTGGVSIVFNYEERIILIN